MRHLRTWFVWWLVFLLVFTSIPMEGLAEFIYSKSDNAMKQSPLKVPEAPSIDLKPGELIGERTENTKVYYNGDGTFTRKIFFEPIHIKKKNEKQFEEVSTFFIDHPNHVQAENTILEPRFYKKMVDGEYAKFLYNEYSISYSILEASGNGLKPIQAKDVPAIYKKKDNKIVHKNVFPNIDLQNIVFNESTKEDLVLHSFTGYHIFKFRLKTDLHANIQDDGSILFTNKENEKVFELPKPFMVDSNIDEHSGEAQRSENVTYELQQDDQGYILTVKADPQWLKDPKRVYPVYIDPSTSVAIAADAFVMSAYPTTNYSSASSKWDAGQGQYVL
ncbi:MAG: Wall-associated protein, partial [Anoxybacillus mongoliensis]|nr:Wall-associated protein [Anoxybacillus mongoliensis]